MEKDASCSSSEEGVKIIFICTQNRDKRIKFKLTVTAILLPSCLIFNKTWLFTSAKGTVVQDVVGIAVCVRALLCVVEQVSFILELAAQFAYTHVSKTCLVPRF